MNVALVGDDPRLPLWAERATQCGARVVSIEGTSFEGAGVRIQESGGAEVAPRGIAGSSGELDAAFAGGNSSGATDAAARVAARLPLLVVPSARQSALLAYRLVLHAEEGAVVMPGFSARYEPAVRELVRRFQQGELGDMQLVRLERTAAASSTFLTREQIDAAFFDDIDLLRLLGGNYRQVTTVLVGARESSVLQATVTLGGDATREATWTISVGDRPAWRLTMIGSQGTAILTDGSSSEMKLTVNDRRIEVPPADPVQLCVAAFLRRCESPPSAAAPDPLAPVWDDYVRAYDLLEAVNRSVRRRRTIDLQFESTSERSQFKTQMATIGCGVLVWTLLGVFLGLALGQLLDPREPLERRAAAAGTVLWADDFAEEGSRPEPAALRGVLASITRDGKEGIVLIEQSDSPDGRDLNVLRKQAVYDAIAKDRDPAQMPQVDVRPLDGGWFRNVMLAIWAFVFAPLGIFLALQLLISVTRGGR